MRTWNLMVMWGCAVACGGDMADSGPDHTDHTDTDDVVEGPKGACGDVTEHDLRLTGHVLRDGTPEEGASVSLEERAWHTDVKVFGNAITDAEGRFELDVPGVVSVENCWGSALAYYLVAVRGDARGELGANGPLYHAIKDAEQDVEILFPIELAD